MISNNGWLKTFIFIELTVGAGVSGLNMSAHVWDILKDNVWCNMFIGIDLFVSLVNDFGFN